MESSTGVGASQWIADSINLIDTNKQIANTNQQSSGTGILIDDNDGDHLKIQNPQQNEYDKQLPFSPSTH